MSGATVKIRLRSGTREIELEGTRADVDGLLKEWWGSSDSHGTADLDDHVTPANNQDKRSKRIRRAATSASSPNEGGNADPSLEPGSIANTVKNHEDFSIFEKKIIHAQRDVLGKVKFIVWLVGKPLSSGQIYRALQVLNIKTTLPQVSKALKKNAFIIKGERKTGGGAPAGYILAAPAQKEFKEWLYSNE